MTEVFFFVVVVHIAYCSRKIFLNVLVSGSSVGAVNKLAGVQWGSRGLIPIEIEIFLSVVVPRPAFELASIV